MDFFDKGIGKVEGLLGIQHLIFTLISIILVVLLIFIFRHSNKDKVRWWLQITFYIVLVLEILKIIWNLTIRDEHSPNNWVPLYFCSLYIFALPMSAFGRKHIKLMGDSFLLFGGVAGGLAFILYPSSSLPIFPLLQVLTLHSLIFHVLLVSTSIIIIITRYYQPKFKDIWLYLIFTTGMSIITFFVNLIFDLNLMFISEPGFIEPLKAVKNVFGIFYTPAIILGQNLGAFFIGYLCYIIIRPLRVKGE